MKKDLGLLQAVIPMPLLMVASYDKDEQVDVMGVSWAQVCDLDKIILFIGEGKKTWSNIQESKAFTVSIADKEHMDMADFFGMASANKMMDKFVNSGYHATKSENVNAPIIEEFPLAMECELLEVIKTEHIVGIVGRIVNVRAEESVLNEDEELDLAKINPVMYFDAYYAMGEKIGDAWGEGRKHMRVSYES